MVNWADEARRLSDQIENIIKSSFRKRRKGGILKNILKLILEHEAHGENEKMRQQKNSSATKSSQLCTFQRGRDARRVAQSQNVDDQILNLYRIF